MEEERNLKGKHTNTRSNREKKGKIIIVGIIFLVIVAISAFLWYNMSLSCTGTAEDKVKIEISMGSSSNKIANILKENDLIKSQIAFKVYVKLNNVTTFQAGTYNLTKDMSVQDIVQALQTGKVFKDTDIKITFVEGKSFTYIAKQIATNTKNTEDDVYELVSNEEYLNSLIDEYWFITDEIKSKDIYYPLEGYLFPDTYLFEDENVTVKEIFKVLLNQMEKVLNNYKEDVQSGKYSIHQLLTVASIVENEAVFDKDRKNVASVVYNRLRSNMSIGSDVTTYYAFKIELGLRDLYKSEINKYNAYNTRGPNMSGKLPVGPICMPSKASIEAAIYPNETDYLFFVADASGNIYFNKTNSAHEQTIKELKANNAWVQF